MRAHRASRQEKTTGARCPTVNERKIVEDLMLRAAAHAADDSEADVARNVSRIRSLLRNFTEDEWWSDEFVLVDELVPEWLRCHANAAAGGEVRTVDSAILRKLRATVDATVGL